MEQHSTLISFLTLLNESYTFLEAWLHIEFSLIDHIKLLVNKLTVKARFKKLSTDQYMSDFVRF